MTRKRQDIKKIPVCHPFLFALFPIMFLYSHNVTQVSVSEIFLPAAITLVFTTLFWLLLSILFKNKRKAGFSATLFLILFFSYDHIYDSIRYLFIGDTKIGRGGYLLIVMGLLLIFATYFAIKSRGNFSKLTSFLNVVASFLVGYQLIMIIYGNVKNEKLSSNNNFDTIELESTFKGPDIYFIILDSYARSDILKESYNYDNSSFLEWLSQRGFRIANRSTSNYAYTHSSLASSLNMAYLDDLAKQLGEELTSFAPFKNLIKYSDVSKFLKKHGYTFVALSSGYSLTEIDNADVFISKSGLLSEFQNVLLNTTPIPKILYAAVNQDDKRRERLLFNFESLSRIPEMESPKFVFAHINSPHWPYVFGKNGEPVKSELRLLHGRKKRRDEKSRGDYIQKYLDQLAFTTKKTMKAIETILSTSIEPPIIVLQSDHGPEPISEIRNLDEITNTSLRERMSILNAIYLPQVGHQELYDSITPVNTFRVIFNSYFGTEYELVKDENYWSNQAESFNFFNVTDRIKTLTYEKSN